MTETFFVLAMFVSICGLVGVYLYYEAYRDEFHCWLADYLKSKE